jgi:hypothetical protein
MRRLDERRVYYESKRQRKQNKSKGTGETSDLQQDDRMSVGDDRDEQLDDSYISGAY